MDADENKQLEELVDRAAAQLAEHFDSVRIFVTRHRGGEEETTQFDSGRGNFYAQLGQVTEWLSIQEQYQRNWAIRNDREKE